MRAWQCIVLAALLGAGTAAAQEPAARPISELDYARLVGRPDPAMMRLKPGLHVWVHRGRVHFAAVPSRRAGAQKRQRLRFVLSSSRPVRGLELGAFRLKRRGEELLLRVRLGADPEQASLVTDGELVISELETSPEGQIHLGPGAQLGTARVRVSRK